MIAIYVFMKQKNTAKLLIILTNFYEKGLIFYWVNACSAAFKEGQNIKNRVPSPLN